MTRPFSSVFLQHEDHPEWFRLDFEPRTGPSAPRLLISFAEAPLRRFCALLPAYAPVEDCKRRLASYGNATDFGCDPNTSWGFGSVLELQSSAPGELGYVITIPQVEKDNGVCQACDGKREQDGFECVHCLGRGRERKNDWDALDRIAATLDVLGGLLGIPDKTLVHDVTTGREQLLSIQTNFGRENAFIGATLSRTFAHYVRSLTGRDLPTVRAAVRSAYLEMFPSHTMFSNFDYKASVREGGQLMIDVPGDACGLYVDGFSRSLKESVGPMELDCHNVDGHHQQLALLCGLATLCGMAKRALYPQRT